MRVAKGGERMGKSTEQSLLLQDAIYYAIRAAESSDYEGTFGDITRTEALRRAAKKARQAGMGGEAWGFRNPSKLSQAEELRSRIEAFAVAHGVDARTGTVG